MRYKLNRQAILDVIKNRKLPLLLWVIPWFILLVVAIRYPKLYIHHYNLAMTDMGFLLICIVMLGLYFITSLYSFRGIFPKILIDTIEEKNVTYIHKPIAKDTLPKKCEKLYVSLIPKQRIIKIAISLCLKDFLIERRNICGNLGITKYIPSVQQIIKYPKESLRLLLSSYNNIHSTETDKYYNFDLAIEICFKTIQYKS